MIFNEVYEIDEETKKDKNYSKIAKELADFFLLKTNAKIFFNSENRIGLYVFDGKKYIKGDDIADKFLDNIYRINNLDEYKIKITTLKKEFDFHINNASFTKMKADKMLISFNNFVFDWREFENYDFEKLHETTETISFLKEHNHNLLVFNYINQNIDTETFLFNVDFDTLAQTIAPKTTKIFRDWVGEKWKLLFEIIGYCLYPSYKFNKAVMVIGDGSNGKSTYLKLLRTILCNDNITSISLFDLVNNRFSQSDLFNKLANVCGDLSKFVLKETGYFKILTGEDLIKADRKFKTQIQFENYAKLIFSANELPIVFDQTKAFWRRWLVIDFQNKFEQNSRFFDENFDEIEISKIISLSLIAFRDVLKRNKFSFEETEADYKEKWLRSSNNIYAFIQDSIKNNIIKRDVFSKELTSDVYQLYVKYCDENELTPALKNTFTKQMETFGFQKYQSNNKYYYKNIKIVENDSETIETLVKKDTLIDENTVNSTTHKTEINDKLKELRQLFNNKIPKNEIELNFTKKEIEKMLSDGVIFESSYGYYCVI